MGDHHSAEYRYKDGVVMKYECRQQPNTMSRVDEQITGTKGRIFFGAGRIEDLDGNVLYQFDRSKENNPYQNEHDVLFEAISKGEFKFKDAEHAAHTTITSIIMRKASYLDPLLDHETTLNTYKNN